MSEPAALNPHAARTVYEVVREQENEVHTGEMGRLSALDYYCLKLAAHHDLSHDDAGRARTARIRPILSFAARYPSAMRASMRLSMLGKVRGVKIGGLASAGEENNGQRARD